jgi:hypothetical protein
MRVYVQVYDEDGAYTIFEIEDEVTVRPDESDKTQMGMIIAKLISGDVDFASNKILNEGSFLMRIAEIQRISSLLNIKSQDDKLSIINYGDKILTQLAFPQIYGPSDEYKGAQMVEYLIIVIF